MLLIFEKGRTVIVSIKSNTSLQKAVNKIIRIVCPMRHDYLRRMHTSKRAFHDIGSESVKYGEIVNIIITSMTIKESILISFPYESVLFM